MVTENEITKEDEKEDDCLWKKFTHEKLEHQYSPSRWSTKYNSDEIIQKHVDETRSRSQSARESVPHRLDVAYDKPCNNNRAKLDVYGENLPHDAPILVYVHGGYWQELHKDVSAYLVPPLYDAGVVVVVVGYDLAPAVSVADIVKQVREAVSWACVLARGRGSTGVVISGWSAGGQLVTQVASEEGSSEGQTQLTQHRDLIRGVVTFSGVFDLRPLVTLYVNDPLKLTPESAWALSPLRGVGALSRVWGSGRGTAHGLKMLVVVGEEDPEEFQRQSKEYCQACTSAGLKADFVTVEKADHFSLVSDLYLEKYPLTKRLREFVDACCKKEKEVLKGEEEREGLQEEEEKEEEKKKEEEEK